MYKTTLLLLCLWTACIIASAQTYGWVLTVGGPSAASSSKMVVDDSSNIFTMGIFWDKVDFDPKMGVAEFTASGNADVFVQKLDREGNFLWAKTFGGPENEIAYDIAVDTWGNVYTLGLFSGMADLDPGPGVTSFTALGKGDIFIQKLDSLGNLIWVKSIGGDSYDYGLSLALDSDNNVYVTGSFRNEVDFDPGAGINPLTSKGSDDIFMLKLDTEGNFIWVKQIGGPGRGQGHAIVVDPKGFIYSTGLFNDEVDFDPGPGMSILSSSGGSDAYLQKHDLEGNLLWVKPLGNGGQEVGYEIALDGAGNIYTTGLFEGIVDFDPGSGTTELTSNGVLDVYVLKLDPGANLQWAKSVGSINFDYVYGLSVDRWGNAYLTGTFEGAGDYDPGSGTTLLTSQGGFDAFLFQLNKDGKLGWAIDIGSTSDENGSSVATDFDGNIYATGNFSGVADFSLDSSKYEITSAGPYDMYILKLEAPDNLPPIDPPSVSPDFIIYPNPTSGLLNVNLPDGADQAQIRVFDMRGRAVHKDLVTPAQQVIDLNHLAAAVYLVDVKLSTGQQYVEKVIVLREW